MNNCYRRPSRSTLGCVQAKYQSFKQYRAAHRRAQILEDFGQLAFRTTHRQQAR
jgi:hypothetical protein